MAAEHAFFKSAAFKRYKKTVEKIAGRENWKASEEFYAGIYRGFLKYRRGYSKLLHLLYLCMKTQNRGDKPGSAGYLNSLLKTYLMILKSEGFEEVKR